ncbi:hypothetical protein OEZ85_008943 [Tetradesmus obliquus]|uniref:Uncharacterized protein n=1 Tax=Tetradesmus obliquus TaxID=3088 RepID=A0ABY8TMD2_TETOB|nr:hypothetical protein OEZ85_008943 [Tetradesmus obliquus]
MIGSASAAAAEHEDWATAEGSSSSSGYRKGASFKVPDIPALKLDELSGGGADSYAEGSARSAAGRSTGRSTARSAAAAASERGGPSSQRDAAAAAAAAAAAGAVPAAFTSERAHVLVAAGGSRCPEEAADY